MTRTQKLRLGAFGTGVVAILLAILAGSGGPGALEAGAMAGRGVGSGAPPSDAATRQGEFRRRNPFQILRAHPPPAPPPAAPPAPASAPPPPTPPPQEPLPLRLTGTLSGDPMGIAFALDVRSQEDRMFQIGDNLGDSMGDTWRGVILTAVRRRTATFSRGAQEWVLRLEEESRGATGASAVVAAPPVALGVRTEAPLAELPLAGAARVVQRDEVEKNLKNLGYLITQLNVQPYFEDGQPSGFRVSRIRPGSFIDKLGARNGDIIQGVNGKPIKTIKDAFLLYNSFKTEKTVNVTVLRGGQAQAMGFQLN